MLLVQNCLGLLYKTLITFHIMWREDFQNGLFRKMVSSLLGAKNVVKGPHHHEWKPPLCSCRLLSLCSSVFTSRVCEGGYRVRKLGCCLKTDVWCISGPHCNMCHECPLERLQKHTFIMLPLRPTKNRKHRNAFLQPLSWDISGIFYKVSMLMQGCYAKHFLVTL